MRNCTQRKSWTKDELEFLKRNYLKKSVKDLADALARSEKAVMARASILGLKKVIQTKPRIVSEPEFEWRNIKKPDLKRFKEKKANKIEIILLALLAANLIAITLGMLLKVL